MNNERRKEIKNIISDIEELNLNKIATDLEAIVGRVEDVMDDEQDAYDNLPASLQDSDKGQAFTETLNSLEKVVDGIRTIIDVLNDDIIGDLKDAAQ